MAGALSTKIRVRRSKKAWIAPPCRALAPLIDINVTGSKSKMIVVG
jgi:hypothetical protein